MELQIYTGKTMITRDDIDQIAYDHGLVDFDRISDWRTVYRPPGLAQRENLCAYGKCIEVTSLKRMVGGETCEEMIV